MGGQLWMGMNSKISANQDYPLAKCGGTHCSPSTQEAEAGGSLWIWLCLKNQKTTEHPLKQSEDYS